MQIKHHSTLISLILITILLTSVLSASDWKLNPGMFNPSGVPSLPFSQPRFADMDADGDMDMILGSTSDKPLYITNTGSSTSPKFSIIDDIFPNVSPLDAEVCVAHDIDADGDLDLITGGHTGLHLYRNTGNAVSPSFEKVEGFFSGLSLPRYPVADMGDIDGDGDLDLIVGFSEDGSIKLYTNSGSNTSATFLESSAITLGDVGLFAYPVFCDPDNDGDLDVLCGQDAHYFTYFKNTGSATSGNWQSDGTVFVGLGSEDYFNSPAMVDINGDGKQDLIFGNYTGPILYYRNSGSSSSPAWTENTTLFGGVIDVGGASSPTFIDIDRDGDMDMFTGTQMGDIKSYYNTGNATVAAFNYNMAHSNLKHSIYSYVSLAEVNGDTSFDALVGDLSGNVYFHAGSGSGFLPASSALNIGNVGGWSVPRFIDMDKDGDQDIVVGNEDGYLTYYENQGSATQPLWSEIHNYFDSLDVGIDCVPAFADLDFDGDYDLLTSVKFYEVSYFENQDGIWVEDTSMVEGIEISAQNPTPAFADLDGDGDQDLIIGNYGGTFDYYENTREVVAIQPTTQIPDTYELKTYPNPFNPSTAISFNLPKDGFVELSIFDLTGKKIASLANGYRSTGNYRINFRANATMSTGIYFCRLQIDGFIADTQKITLLK